MHSYDVHLPFSCSDAILAAFSHPPNKNMHFSSFCSRNGNFEPVKMQHLGRKVNNLARRRINLRRLPPTPQLKSETSSIVLWLTFWFDEHDLELTPATYAFTYISHHCRSHLITGCLCRRGIRSHPFLSNILDGCENVSCGVEFLWFGPQRILWNIEETGLC